MTGAQKMGCAIHCWRLMGLPYVLESPRGDIDGVALEFFNGLAGTVSASVSMPNVFLGLI